MIPADCEHRQADGERAVDGDDRRVEVEVIRRDHATQPGGVDLDRVPVAGVDRGEEACDRFVVE